MAASDGDGGQTRVRASAGDNYERVKHDATEELERPAAALAFSGLSAGATVGFGAVAAAAVSASLVGDQSSRLLAAVFFPIGFIVVIIGRAQLFTENTLYPVTLVLDERRHLLATARLWAIVLGANLLGAILFAVLATKSGALDPDVIAKPGSRRSPRDVRQLAFGVLERCAGRLDDRSGGMADPVNRGGERSDHVDLGAGVSRRNPEA